MLKTIIAIAILLCFVSPGIAQQQKRFWDFSDAALAGSFIADEATTRNLFTRCDTCYEKGVIKNTGARIGVKVGIFSAFKLIDWRAPKTRTATRWVKVGVAVAFAFVSYKNSKLK